MLGGVKMIPKIIFKEMSLEENIEHIKWMVFDNEGEFSISDATLQYFPDLRDTVNLSSKGEIYKEIENLVKECYEYSLKQIKMDVIRYNQIWEKYNDSYFIELSKYLNVNWPKNKEIIEAKVGLIPVFPRYLDNFSFALSFSLNDEKVIETAAHETLHFLWFEKWKEIYPKCSRKEYDSPYMPWKYSEMVTDPILNSDNIKSILNIEEKAYDNFYNIKDGESSMMENLKLIYKSKECIESRIIKGYEYVKRVLR